MRRPVQTIIFGMITIAALCLSAGCNQGPKQNIVTATPYFSGAPKPNATQ